ncbi:MAG: glycogen synthase GlgA [Acidobacteria bacterium]|nr:glycogen synthase GlgA [Acidobacteriota bacterium]
MKILYVSAEMVPFAKEGGLADVAGALPVALSKEGIDVRTIMPAYRKIDRKKFSLKPVKGITPVKINYNGQELESSLLEGKLPGSDVIAYFVENEYFFGREGVYNNPDTKEGYEDNAERFVFFTRSIMELIKQLGWQPDLIHLNDHHTSLIAAYIKRLHAHDNFYKKMKVLLSIHNLGYQGIYPKEIMWFAMFDQSEYYPMSAFEFFDKVNFMKIGIIFSDIINTVSKTYAQEIMSSEEYGFGLEGVLRDRKDDLYGIVNGIDYSVWNPETDELIPNKFSIKDLTGKTKNKELLIKEQGLSFAEKKVPLLGIISRLADQKGFDILEGCMDDLMENDIRLIVLGTGQKKYHDMFEEYSKKYPGKIGVNLTFNNELAHKIEAASDMFLMPSRYEPCGLNQLYSMKYGTIPIVRTTGGLKDTVTPFDSQTGKGTGFTFDGYSSEELMVTISKALMAYQDKDKWAVLVQNAMNEDFSWSRSAKEYIELYNKALKK